MSIKTYLKRKFPFLLSCKRKVEAMSSYQRFMAKRRVKRMYFPKKSSLGSCGKNAVIEYPVLFENPKGVFIEENACIRMGCHIVNAENEKVIIKKYTVLAPDCVIVADNHRSTVGIPHFLLAASHVNDQSADVIIEEDVWVGIRVTLLPGTHLGRGCIIGAGSVVSGDIPPYALAIGSPAKVVKKIFSDVEAVMRHEKALYPSGQRMSREQLQVLFDNCFQGKKTYGTDAALTPEQEEIIVSVKQWLRFVEPC